LGQRKHREDGSNQVTFVTVAGFPEVDDQEWAQGHNKEGGKDSEERDVCKVFFGIGRWLMTLAKECKA
jgi:hypothetical protein